MKLDTIRNFCIVAHIDHGKSTLADRLLEITATVGERQMREQFLDSHAIERERGITIKAKSVQMHYRGYMLNLIDTPGHVDFAYEVSRSLAACEGAVLLVDATQGVQAQTLANAAKAVEAGLAVVPAVNKIDMDLARPDEVVQEMVNTLGMEAGEILRVSAKAGTGVRELLDAVLARVPPPEGDPEGPLQALVFDSTYNDYRGVILNVRMVHGRIRAGDRIRLRRADHEYDVEEVGIFAPAMRKAPELAAGAVGYVIAGIRALQDVRVGETVVRADDPATAALPGYQEPLPVVFSGIYPAPGTSHEDLKRGLEKLSLNDSSFTFEPDTSEALGQGFRCGFLGLLHMDVFQERLERDLGIQAIRTAPNVTYEIVVKRGGRRQTLRVDNPARMPEDHLVEEWHEPYVRLDLILPSEFIGPVMKLCEDRRAIYVRTEYLSPTRVRLTYDFPFAEMVYDYYDRFKSATRGYGSLDYQWIGLFPSDLVRLRILVAGAEVDALSTIVHKARAESLGRRVITILRKEIPRHLFQVALQASVGKRIVARDDIRALAKHVTGKCYGGDITRKRKLWEKQKAGKRRMKAVGRVEIPQEAFMAVLKATAPEE